MEEDFKVIENYLMVRMPEELDHHKSVAIRETADRMILREDVKNIVFDFEDTRFMDSSGIGVIMGRYKTIHCLGGQVFAIHADGQIKRILRMSGLKGIIEVLD
ncbi:MAG: anti-sigma factor antagonist [Lachnospiraceae bacterium]|nr:anti-sigma factor antagonist [Lachnospiraceae bacterium]